MAVVPREPMHGRSRTDTLFRALAVVPVSGRRSRSLGISARGARHRSPAHVPSGSVGGQAAQLSSHPEDEISHVSISLPKADRQPKVSVSVASSVDRQSAPVRSKHASWRCFRSVKAYGVALNARPIAACTRLKAGIALACGALGYFVSLHDSPLIASASVDAGKCLSSTADCGFLGLQLVHNRRGVRPLAPRLFEPERQAQQRPAHAEPALRRTRHPRLHQSGGSDVHAGQLARAPMIKSNTGRAFTARLTCVPPRKRMHCRTFLPSAGRSRRAASSDYSRPQEIRRESEGNFRADRRWARATRLAVM